MNISSGFMTLIPLIAPAICADSFALAEPMSADNGNRVSKLGEEVAMLTIRLEELENGSRKSKKKRATLFSGRASVKEAAKANRASLAKGLEELRTQPSATLGSDGGGHPNTRGSSHSK